MILNMQLKFLYILITLLILSCTGSRKNLSSGLKTLKYAGTYDMGKPTKERGHKGILIYPETDSTVLFFIDLVRGYPSHNMGSLFGRVKIVNDTGTFYTKLEYENNPCSWFFSFSEKAVDITSIYNNCGFGNAVSSDGHYLRKKKKIPESFYWGSEKIYFEKTRPEDYN